MDTGDEIDLDVTSVAHGGVFVGRIGDPSDDSGRGGRVVFVPDAIPGERVRIRLTDVGKKSFWRGEVLEVLDASPHRRPHIWRQADVSVPPHLRPGGADFGHIELSHQRVLKLEVLTDALRRFGGVEVPGIGIHPAGVDPRESALDPRESALDPRESALDPRESALDPRESALDPRESALDPRESALDRETRALSAETRTLSAETRTLSAGDGETEDGSRWRTRVSLHVDADGYVGPFAARSHSVIAVEEYPLATAAVEHAALQLAQARPGRIDLVQPADGRVRVIPRADAAKSGPREAREVITERVGDREFRVDAGGFWQVHRLAAATLDGAFRAAILDLAGNGPALDPDAWHLDLYGGVGLFAAALAELGGPRVTSVESDARATDHAGWNLSEWAGARAETARVDRYVSRLLAEASDRERARLVRGVTVLDPPRSGAGRAVVEGVAALGPAAVVYVACDPVALARDVATFQGGGYELRAVTSYDLFPNSHHVEAIATFVRSDGNPQSRR